MAQTKIKATAQLFLDTSSAESDAKQFVDDIKKKLGSIETAADKMTVFKDMVSYINKVDKALAVLRAKNGDAFNHMFDGMDVELRKQFENIFGITDDNLGKLDLLRDKLATLTPQSKIAEIRQFAKDLNEIFVSAGVKAPFDIETEFKGKASPEHINKLTDALTEFATVWSGVNSKVKSGFGFGGNASSGVVGDISHLSIEVQEQIQILNGQIIELEDVKKKFSKISNEMKDALKPGGIVPDSYSIDVTVDSVKELMAEFDGLELEMESMDKTSADYYNSLLRISEVSLKLKKALSEVKANDTLTKAFQGEPGGAGFGGNFLGKLYTYANNNFSKISGKVVDIEKNQSIDHIIQTSLDKIETLKNANKQVEDFNLSNGNIVQETNQTINTIEECKEKIISSLKEFYYAVYDAYDAGIDTDSGEMSEKMKAIQNDIYSVLDGMQVNQDIKNRFVDLFGDLMYGELDVDDIKQEVTNLFKKFNIEMQKQDVVSVPTSSTTESIDKNVDDTITAIEEGKKQIIDAWKDYYHAAMEAESQGIKIEGGEATSYKMDEIKSSIQKKLDSWKVNGNAKFELGSLDEYIVDKDIGIDDIEERVSKIFKDYNVKLDIPLQVEFDTTLELQTDMSNLANSSQKSTNEIVSDLNNVEIQTHDVASAFQELITYISQSGISPKLFFKNLESGTLFLDEQLSGILSKLNLIDDAGNVKFSAINSGSINSGGMISDEYALISRDKKYLKYALESQPKLFEAEKLGANVGTILNTFVDEANGLVYELQKKVNGVGITDQGHKLNNTDFLNATDSQIKKLIEDFAILQKVGLYVDYNGKNILYDQNDGFSFVDLASKSTWFTASQENSVQENIHKFIDSIFGPNPSVDGGKFTERVNKLMEDFVNKSIPLQDIEPHKVDTQNHKNSVVNITAEKFAHEQNTDAISAENAAIEAQIELKKKAQSMTWEAFALDESSADLKKTAGFQTLSDMEKFWKKSNYDKKIDFYEIQDLDEIDQIISDNMDYGLRSKWYGSQDFDAKTKIENAILANDQLRNAALNKLYQIYKKYVDSAIDFDTFLNSEFTLYRGDSAPVLYGDEQSLSYSFKKSVADNFDSGNTHTVKIFPKDTTGNVATSAFKDELEVFVPGHKTPFDSSFNQSFDAYYDSLKKSMKDAVDQRLIDLEKKRVKNLLGKDLANIVENAQTMSSFYPQQKIFNDFAQGIIPSSIDDSSSDILGFEQFAKKYNNLSEIQKKLVAYYTSLTTLSNAYEEAYEPSSKIGKTGILSAIMNDKTGVKKHTAELTGEFKYGLVDESIKSIDAETVSHQKNTQVIQAETHAQQALNDTKLNYEDVQNKIADAFALSDPTSDYGDKLGVLYHNIGYTNENFKNISNGTLKSSVPLELDIADTFSLISEIEQQYGDNLDYVKDYLQQVLNNIKSGQKLVSSKTDTIDELDIDLDFDDELLLDDEPTLYDAKDFTNEYNKQTESAKKAIDDYALHYKKFIDLQSKVKTDQIDMYFPEVPDPSEIQEVLGLLEEFKQKQKEIYAMPFVKTEDDKEKLFELEAAVMGIQNKLRGIYIPNGTVEDYEKAYGVQYEDASILEALAAGENMYPVLSDAVTELAYRREEMLEKVSTSLATAIDLDGTGEADRFLLHLAEKLQKKQDIKEKFPELEQYIQDNYVSEDDIHQENTQAIQTETQAQNELNDAKLSYNDVQKKLLDIYQNSSDYGKKSALTELDNYMVDAHYTENDFLQDGNAISHFTGEVYPISDIINHIQEIEQQYGENLDFVKQYIQAVIADAKIDGNNIKNIPSTDSEFEEITIELEDEANEVNSAVEKEQYALNELVLAIDEVKAAVQAKTQAFTDEGLEVSQVVQQEIGALSLLLDKLDEVRTSIKIIQDGLTIINNADVKPIENLEGKVENIVPSEEQLSKIQFGNIATESTLSAIQGLLSGLSAAISEKDNEQDLSQLISALTTASTNLKDVANGIVQHQKAQKTDTSDAMARITDKDEYRNISDIAKASIGNLGTNVELDSLKALANGIVKVDGAFKNVNGEWEGFTVKVNQANEAVDFAIKKQSSFAKSCAVMEKALADASNETDENKKLLSSLDTYQKALEWLNVHKSEGKNTTLQYKDSGSFTVSAEETIGGITRTTFRTFDQDMKDLERTTVTVSDNIAQSIIKVDKEINDSTNNIANNDAYKKYLEERDKLFKMNEQYETKASLSQDEIDTWNKQIVLVQKLGGEVLGLIKKQEKLNNQKGIAISKEKLTKYKGTANQLLKNTGIDLNTTDSEQQKVVSAYEAVIEKVALLKNNHEALTDEQINDVNALVAALKQEADAYIQIHGITKKEKKSPKIKQPISKKTAEEKAYEQIYLGSLKKQKDALEGSIKGLGIEPFADNLTIEQKEIADAYIAAKVAVSQYEEAIKKGEQAEMNAVINTVDALKQKTDEYRKQNNIIDQSKKVKGISSGTIEGQISKFNALDKVVNDEESPFVGAASVQTKFAEYSNALDNLKTKYIALQGVDPTSDDKISFKEASTECNKLRREVESLIKAYNKERSDPEFVDAMYIDDFVNTTENRKKELQNYIETVYGASAKIGNFRNNFNELLFTINNGDGTFTNAKVKIDSLGTSIIETAGEAQRSVGKFESFINGFKIKFGQIATYLAASFGWQEIWQQIRQGFQYVREIDAALTELKKVTNETDLAYDNFLQTMSKTAGTVGSTVSELTTMAADWARLGYSMEDSAKLAESTAILLNVSEFQDATAASEALISTMQAFQYTADESQHVVDILNEVGKLLPVDNYIG